MSGAPAGLDFGAIMAVASAQDVDLDLLTLALPEVETAILAGLAGDDAAADED